MPQKQEIICLGELLWDALPGGLFMGGAPLNVSLHLHELGERAAVASSVGSDRLGDEIFRRLESRGADTSLIQRDEELETGFVKVKLDTPDKPDYDIVKPVAWDRIRPAGELSRRAEQAWGLLFGSLGQRSGVSRDTTQALLNNEELFRVFDMNLRFPHVSREVIEASLPAADMLKMNEEELQILQEWYGLPADPREAMETLAGRFSCRVICLTRGSEGSALLMDGTLAEHPGYPVEVADAVGAGDAFLAAALHGIRRGEGAEQILAFANGVGAFTASRPGGTPIYSKEDVKQLMRGEHQP